MRFQGDADLNQHIVKGVRRREPAIDFADAQRSKLDGLADSEVLAFAAQAGRVLVTHDQSTMPDCVRQRLSTGGETPGVLVVPQSLAVVEAIDAIVLLWSAGSEADMRNQVRWLPSLERHVFVGR